MNTYRYDVHSMKQYELLSQYTLSDKSRCFQRYLSFIMLVSLFFMSCNDIPADNPYDPVAPVVQQAKSIVRGQLKLPENYNDEELLGGKLLTLVPQRIELKVLTSTPSTNDGQFTFEQVAAGIYELSGNIPGIKEVSTVVIVEQGIDLNLTEYQLEPDDTAATDQWIEGIVRFEGSEEDVHGGIRIETLDHPFHDVTTSSGRFRLNVPANRYTLKISYPGYQTKTIPSVNVTIGIGQTLEEDIILERDLSSSINGQLQTVDPDYNFDGSIVSLESLSISGPSINRSETVAGEGRFSFDMLPSGSYSITATVAGHLEFSKSFRIEIGVNDLGLFHLTPEYEAPEQAPFLRGKAFLSEELNRDGDTADHSGIKVTAIIENGDRLLTKVETIETGEFAFVASREPIRLEFSKEGYTYDRSISVVWSADQERFEYNDTSFEEYEGIILNQNVNAEIIGQLSSDRLLTFDWNQRTLITLEGQGIIRRISPLIDGSFRLDSLPSGQYALRINAEGHNDYNTSLVLDQSEKDLGLIELSAGSVQMNGLAKFSTTDNDLNVHGGITVQAFINEDLIDTAQTAADGRYALTALSTNFTLSFIADGYITSTLNVDWNETDERFEVFGTALEEYDELVLLPDLNSSLTGTLQTPILNYNWVRKASVKLGEISVIPNGDGYFRFGPLQAGRYDLEVTADGHVSSYRSVNLDGNQVIEEIRLTPEFEAPEIAQAPSLRGLIYLDDQDINSGDHSGIIVEAYIENALVGTALSNITGNYALTASRDTYTLRFIKEGYISSSDLTVFWDEDQGKFIHSNTNTDLEVYTSLRLRPDLNASVVGQLSTSISDWDWLNTTSVKLIGDSNQRTAIIGGNIFEFINLRQGLYGLEIEVDGHISISRVIEVESGINTIGTFELTPGIGEAISGRVSLADATDSYPNRNISVTATINQNIVASTLTDSDGYFTIQSSQSSHQLKFSKEGYNESQVNIIWSNDSQAFTIDDANNTQLNTYEDLVLQINPGSVNGRIFYSSELGNQLIPANDVSVAVYEGDLLRGSSQTTPEGLFTIPSLRQGLYQIRFGGDRFTQGQEIVQVTAGVVTNFGERTLDIKRGSAVGRVVTNSGRADVITVRLIGQAISNLDGLVWTTTTTNGEYRLEDLPPGQYSLFTTSAGYTNVTYANPITISADQETTIDDIEILQRQYEATAEEVVTSQATVLFIKDSDVNMAKVWIQGEDVPNSYQALLGVDQDTANIILPNDGHYTILSELATDSLTDNDQDNDHLIDISPILSIDVTRDSIPPQLSQVRIADGSMYTSNPQISLLIDCIDELAPTNRLSLRIEGNDGSSFDGSYEPYLDYFLADQLPDGERTLTVTCIDWAGNESASETIQVLLDRTPPVISVLNLNGGGINEPSASTTVNVQLNSIDIHSGVESIAISETDRACSEMAYQYPSDGPGVLNISAGEGNRQVFACAKDRAGNYSFAAVGSNVLDIDTTPPALGSIQLGSSAWSNISDVNLTVNNRELDAKLHLVGDIFEVGVHEGNAIPSKLTLTDPDGLKVVSAWFEDAAGNTSAIFSDSITLDRVSPGLGQVILANDQEQVNTQTVSVQVSNTIAHTMNVWEVDASDEQCLSKNCDEINFVPFVPTSTFTLTPELEDKQVCWQFCDEAGNGSIVGGKQITLDTHIPRPIPILSSINPRNHLSFSQDDDPNGYLVTVGGRGIAFDTKVKFGAFTLDCTPNIAAITCRADLNGGCGENGLCSSTCATECTFQLSPQIVANAGTYPIRLETPQPVEDGLGISEELLFFDVVSPIPKVTNASLRGLTQAVINGSPVGQTIEFDIFGQNFTDNVQFKLGPNFAQVLELGSPDDDNIRSARILLSTDGIMPSDLVDQTLNAINPTPGGGVSNDLAFGVNPEVSECPDGHQCISNLRLTRSPTPDFKSLGQRYRFSEPFRTGLRTSHGTSAAWRDEQGQLLFRALGKKQPIQTPYMFEQNISIQVNDSTFSGPQVMVRESPMRNNGLFVAQTPVSFSDNIYDVALGDWNKDGYLDLALPQYGLQGILISMGKEDGTFETSDLQVLQLTCHPQKIESADLSGDGILDLIVGCNQSGLKVFYGLPNGLFDSTPLDDTFGNYVRDIDVKDITGDQRADVISIESVGLYFHRGMTDGSLENKQQLLGGSLYKADLGDLNHDGQQDIIVVGHVNENTDFAQVLLNEGNGVFSQLNAFNLPANTLSSSFLSDHAYVELIDINLDGSLDAIFAQNGNDLFSIYIGDGLGQFEAYDSVSINSPLSSQYNVGTNSLTSGDLNGDGLVDIVLGGEGFGNGSYLYWNKIISVDRIGKIQTLQTIPLNFRSSRVQVADINHDGISDLINSNSFGSVQALFGQGTVATGQNEILTYTDESLTRVLDFDFVDLIVDGQDQRGLLVNRDENYYTFYLYNSESNTFEEKQTFIHGGNNLHTDLVDWNGDGDLDILIVNLGGSLSIIDGEGDGTFQAFNNSPPGIGSLGEGTTFTRHCTVKFNDFNDDGKVDINLSIKQDNVFYIKRIFQNDTYGLGSSSQIVTNSPYFVLADVNGDLRPDVVSVDHDNHGLRASITAVDGTLGDWTSLSNEPIERFLVHDLDGDGLVDFIVQRANINEIAFLRQQSDYSFILDEVYPFTDAIKLGSAVGDINGDGALDMVGYHSDQETYIRYGIIGGGFEANTTKIASPSGGTEDENNGWWRPSEERPQIYDVNQDGVDDILLPSKGDGSLHIIKPSTPSWWAQELNDMPSTELTLANGINELNVHQAKQFISKLSVRVKIEGTNLNQITLQLRAPDGRKIILDDGSSHANDSVWIGHYPTDGTVCPLGTLHGWQPKGNWTLIAEVGNGTVATVTDFAVLTHGTFTQPNHDVCQNPIPMTIGETIWGETKLGKDSYAGSCPIPINRSPEQVYTFVASDNGSICLNTFGSDFDTVLYVRSATCNNSVSEESCNDDDRSQSPQSQIDMAVVAGERYFVFVDGYDLNDYGSFILNSANVSCAEESPTAPNNICE